MNPATLIRVAQASILANKMRSLLTMLGIIIGVGAVIVMVAIGQGAQGQIQEQIDNLGSNMIVITPGSSSSGGVSRGAQSFNRLTVDDALDLKEQSYLLSSVSPVILSFGQIVGGTGNWRAPVQGVSTDYGFIRDWDVKEGRWFDESDMRAMRKVAILGNTVAENLYPDGDAVGQTIRLRKVPFEIVGVLEPKGQSATGEDQDDTILAPYTTVQSRLSGRQFIAQILASTSSPEDIEPAQEEISLILRDLHDLADWEDDDFEVRNQTDLAETAQATTETMTLLLAAIAGISLIVGGIGIMNIMLVSVTERTREIGIRRAVGARSADVLIQFLIESVVIAIVGGLIGMATGFTAAVMVSHFTGWATSVSPYTVLLALGFSASVGIFFGFYPARKAAALDPIEALRYE